MASAVEDYASALKARDQLRSDLDKLAEILRDAARALASPASVEFATIPGAENGEDSMRIPGALSIRAKEWKSLSEIQSLIMRWREAHACLSL